MATACVLVGLLVAPAVATAGWLPAVNLSDPSNDLAFGQEPQIAVDASGGALAIWPQLQENFVIQASSKVGGTWGPPVDISPPGEESITPQVAMNAAGHAVAIWARLGSQITIEGANRTPQGIWVAADGLSVPGGTLGFMDVAIDPAGRAVAIWTRHSINTSDYVIEAATRSPAGQWGPPVPLSEPGNNAWRPRLAVDPSGRVVAAWYRWNDDGDTIIQVAEKEPGKAWSEPEDLSAKGGNAHNPEVAVSAERAVVVWERDQVVEAAARGAGKAWQPPIEIAEPESREPAIGMDPEGNALAIWNSGPEIGSRKAEVASLPLGGTWTKPITLSKRLSGEGAQPQVAVDSAGRAMAIWTAWDGTARILEAASGATGGNWGSPVTVSPPDAWPRHPQVAMDSAGNAAAVWRAASFETVQVASSDVTNPVFNSVSIPPLGRAGRPLAFAASPFDAWSSINPVSWTFGDASTAVGPSVFHSFQKAGQFQVTVTATDAAGHSTTALGHVNVTPALAISNRIITVRRNGRARLKLYCPGTAVCHGNARLTRRVETKKGRRHSGSIGETEFAIPAEARKTVPIKLNPRGLSLFLATHKNRLRARLKGNAVEPRTVLLKPVVRGPAAPPPDRRSR